MALVSLADYLADWTDWDGATYALGQLGNGLREALLAWVAAGVLERREEPDEQFRWAFTMYAPDGAV